jgi:hypothetical protein
MIPIDKVIKVREAKIKRLENKMKKEDAILLDLYHELEYFKEMRVRINKEEKMKPKACSQDLIDKEDL